jgi:hypothetical protein
MPMKAPIFIFALAVSLALGSPVQAKSLLSEVTPAATKAAGFAVEVTHEKIADGTVRFRVIITEQGGTFSSAPSVALKLVKRTAGGGSITASITTGRELKFDKRDHFIVCIFTVTQAVLDTPDLCFVFTNGVERMVNGKLEPMPAADFVYARLKDFAR